MRRCARTVVFLMLNYIKDIALHAGVLEARACYEWEMFQLHALWA